MPTEQLSKCCNQTKYAVNNSAINEKTEPIFHISQVSNTKKRVGRTKKQSNLTI